MDLHEQADASLREVMGTYPTGVTVVAGADAEGLPYGLTVNSFTSVSLDPPLVLVCIGHASTSHARLITAQTFTINVLAADQSEVALRFAREPSDGRFEEVDWTPAASGAPIIEGSAAWLECSVHEVLSGGDHSILVGRVERAAVTERPVLVFHRGRMSATDT
ncbi:MAG: flavin reductase family protein [Gemmatimonadota bacterium]|nr:flavin reductase family protein [Gemmatimonadota bacterium]MDH3424843.1 flavin reductase family protein [Gemmatimonadota bacterium]